MYKYDIIITHFKVRAIARFFCRAQNLLVLGKRYVSEIFSIQSLVGIRYLYNSIWTVLSTIRGPLLQELSHK